MTDAQQPTTVEGAQARLSELTKDADFGAKLMANDVATRAEFNNLTTLAAGLEKRPGAEELQAIHDKQADDRNAESFIKSTKESVDVRDEVLRQAIYDETVPKTERDAVEQWLKRAMSDEAWSKRLLAGGAEERRQLFLASVVLSKEAAA
jgi:hypothetical protein